MKNFLAPVTKSKVMQAVGKFYLAHEGAILTGGTIGFSLATTAVTYRNATKINHELSEAKKRLAVATTQDQKNEVYASTLKALVPLVAPIVLFQTATICTALYSKKQYDKKLAAAASALTIAEQAVAQYQAWQKETEEALGEKKYKKLQKEVAENTIYEASSEPVNQKQSESDQLFYEPVTGQLFWSNPDKVNLAWVKYREELRNSDECFVPIGERFIPDVGADYTAMAANVFGYYNEDAIKMDDEVSYTSVKVRVGGTERSALSICYYPTISFFGEMTN